MKKVIIEPKMQPKIVAELSQHSYGVTLDCKVLNVPQSLRYRIGGEYEGGRIVEMTPIVKEGKAFIEMGIKEDDPETT